MRKWSPVSRHARHDTSQRSSGMDDRELRALEDHDEWDRDRAEVRPPSKSARAVVSVAFARADFDRVSDAARHEGRKTSEFIRDAALSHVMRRGIYSRIMDVTGHGGFRGVGADVTIAQIGVKSMKTSGEVNLNNRSY